MAFPSGPVVIQNSNEQIPKVPTSRPCADIVHAMRSSEGENAVWSVQKFLTSCDNRVITITKSHLVNVILSEAKNLGSNSDGSLTDVDRDVSLRST